jgi:chromosome transmission fidelity protein 1
VGYDEIDCARRTGLIIVPPPAGRAIRHKNDWSMLVLVDMRYQSEKIQSKLPRWIGKSLVVTQSFGQAVKTASQFFASRKES